jgi:hypothetical protein
MMKYLFGALFVLVFSNIACNPEDLLKEPKAPVVSDIHASVADFTINPGESIHLWVDASDPDGGSLIYHWTTELDGAIVGTALSDTLRWKAAQVGGGNYWVRCEVSNDEKTTTRTGEVIVRSGSNPFLKLISPEQGDYLVQFTEYEIIAECGHENGISMIGFWVNDTLKHATAGRLDDRVDTFSYVWPADAGAGTVEIKVIATARVTGAQAADSINISLEGIVPGKK